MDEAIYRLLSIRLKESNRKIVFLPTDEPQKRTSILKSKKDLESLPEDSTDIFQRNMLDRYAARTNKLDNLCYADFGAMYAASSDSSEDRKLVNLEKEKPLLLKMESVQS